MLTLPMETREQAAETSAAIYAGIRSEDSGMQKRAVDGLNAFTRVFMREDGFLRRILPPLPVENSELDKSVTTDKPMKILELEPYSPAAMSVGFGTQPHGYHIKGRKYQATFRRILTPRFYKDVDELRTWEMDIRQVLSDNSIKDMLAEEDGKWISCINTAMVGPEATCPFSGVVQYRQFADAIDRDSLWESFNVLPGTPSSLEVKTVLINHLTIKKVLKLNPIEIGDSLSQDLMEKGWTSREFMGVTWIITIKRSLVPTNSFFFFADPSYTGKFLTLEDATMFVKREAFMIDFFTYELLSVTLGNPNSVARVDFEST